MKSQGRWKGPSRHIATFPKPKEIKPGYVLAFRILVPASAVNIASDVTVLPKDLIWVPPPAPDKAVEVALILTAWTGGIDGWPGRRSMSTGLVGHFPIDDDEGLWLVHREVPIPTLPTARGSVSGFVPDKALEKRLHEARAFALINVEGTPVALMEGRIEDEQGIAARGLESGLSQ